MPSSKNAELHWRCRGLSIGFIALAGIKMSKNSRTSLIVIGKNDAYVKILEFPFLRYGTMKNRKLLFLTGYKKNKEFVCLVSKSFDIQTISYKTLTPEYL